MIKGNKDRMGEEEEEAAVAVGWLGGGVVLLAALPARGGAGVEVNCGVNGRGGRGGGGCRLKVRPLLRPAGGPRSPVTSPSVVSASVSALARSGCRQVSKGARREGWNQRGGVRMWLRRGPRILSRGPSTGGKTGNKSVRQYNFVTCLFNNVKCDLRSYNI